MIIKLGTTYLFNREGDESGNTLDYEIQKIEEDNWAVKPNGQGNIITTVIKSITVTKWFVSGGFSTAYKAIILTEEKSVHQSQR